MKPQPLTFEQFSAANGQRCEQAFFPIESWSGSDWGNALAGETGEACNLLKKLRRLDEGADKPFNAGVDRAVLIAKLGKELVDIITYADLTAQRFGLKLAELVPAKFNEVSDRVHSDIKL